MDYKLQNLSERQDISFNDDVLGRKDYAEALRNLIHESTNGCVIALCGEWGTGKTTFVKMLRHKMSGEGFTTMYFNAWETDWLQDPMIGLIGELESSFSSEKTKSLFGKMMSAVGDIVLAAVPAMGKGVLMHYAGAEAADATEALLTGATKNFAYEIARYRKEISGFERFRTSLAEIAALSADGKPLVFFVDELDRCSPHYAVKTLERIKHLFAVPSVVFVLSIAKRQLCNSIRGYFGSDRIDAEEYLRRFIDIECTLPEPPGDTYIDFLYDRLDFTHVLLHATGRGSKEYVYLAKELSAHKPLTLRQQEKLMTALHLALRTALRLKRDYIDSYTLLVYLKLFNPAVYDAIKAHSYSAEGLGEAFTTAFSPTLYSLSENDGNSLCVATFISAFARLLACYCADIKEGASLFCCEKEDSKRVPLFTPQGMDEEKYRLAVAETTGMEMQLSWLFPHIDMARPFGKDHTTE